MAKTEHEISVSTSTLFKITAVVLTLFFLWIIRDILVVLLIAITFASGLEPMVDYFNQKKVPRAVSVLSVYLLVIGLFVLVAYTVVPSLVGQFKNLNTNQAELTAAFHEKLGDTTIFGKNLAEIVTEGVRSFGDKITGASSNAFQTTIGFFNGIIEVVTVLVVSFYLLAERNGMKNFIFSFVPESQHANALNLVTKIQKKIGWWLIAQLITSAVIFALVFIGLTILGVKYALVLAILAGFLELIPFIGPILAAIPGVLFAYIQDPGLAILVAIMYILIQKTEGYFLVPKIMQKTLGISPLVILIAILVGLKVSGILGALLAVPITAAISVFLKERKEFTNNHITPA